LWAAHGGYNGMLPRSIAEVPVPTLAQQLKNELAQSWHRVTATDYKILPAESSAWLGLNDLRGAEIPLSLRYVYLMPHPAFQIGGSWSIDMLADPGSRRLLELMGVRHVVVTDRSGTHTVDLPGALPRLFWAEKLRRSTGEIPRDLEILRQGEMIAELPAEREPRDGAGRLRMRPIDVNSLTVEAEATRPGLLVLNEMWIQGWRVRVDGQPAPVLPVNIAQVGVWLEAGRHTVYFTFLPRGVLLGGTLSLGGLVIMLALAVRVWRSRTAARDRSGRA
jgi:hypothetical protein